jgi:hypothetical protein
LLGFNLFCDFGDFYGLIIEKKIIFIKKTIINRLKKFLRCDSSGTQLQKIIIFNNIFLNFKINFFVNKSQKHIGFSNQFCRGYNCLSNKKKLGLEVAGNGGKLMLNSVLK